ncbi:MAG: thiolase family protein [Deltaproteobacteria bacterium]|nr:thiolase family protein [Deltaproteobacteria bacterium]
MAQKVYIAGYHQSPFGKLMALSIPEIVEKAVRELARNCKFPLEVVDTASIGACCAPLLNDQVLLSGLIAMVPELEGKPIESVENACASGGTAVLSVIYKILSGQADVGIAVGIEKMRDNEGKMDGKLIGKALGTASYPADREGKLFVFPHIFAEIMGKYIAEWGTTERELAHVPATFYEYANKNPYAQMKDVKMTVDKIMTIEGPNRYIVEGLPLKTFECSQISDGYAAVAVCNENGLKKLGIDRADAVEVAGFSQITDRLAMGGRDVVRPKGAYKAVKKAYDMAGVTPKDIGVAEVHDCFGIMGAMSAEILGKVEPGRGAKFFVDGKARLDGELPINTSGGLIAKGHPIGATGVAMIGWIYWQLTGKAPAELQVKNLKYGATFNIGGPICASVVTILKPA